ARERYDPRGRGVVRGYRLVFSQGRLDEPMEAHGKDGVNREAASDHCQGGGPAKPRTVQTHLHAPQTPPMGYLLLVAGRGQLLQRGPRQSPLRSPPEDALAGPISPPRRPNPPALTGRWRGAEEAVE